MRKKIIETKGVRIETHKYFQSDTQRIMEKINKQISSYKLAYGRSPQFIVISRELATLFDIQLNLMTQMIGVMVGDAPLEFYSIWGIPCIVSRALTGTQFEVR